MPLEICVDGIFPLSNCNNCRANNIEFGNRVIYRFRDCLYLKNQSIVIPNTKSIALNDTTLGFANPLDINLGYEKFAVSITVFTMVPMIE